MGLTSISPISLPDFAAERRSASGGTSPLRKLALQLRHEAKKVPGQPLLGAAVVRVRRLSTPKLVRVDAVAST